MRAAAIFTFPVAVAFASVLTTGCNGDDRAARESIRAEVEAARTPDYATGHADARQIWTSARDFYRARAFRPVWLQERRATPEMKALVEAVTRADRDGLAPARYDLSFLDEGEGQERKRFSEDAAGEVDVRLTLAYLALASDLADGASDLAESHPTWHMRQGTFDAAAHLTAALEDDTTAQSLEALRPTNPEYRALGELLATYRDRARKRSDTVDADGVAVADRIKQIELNMERWRWLPRERPARHIVVNIPAFRLDVWERDRVALSMRVVVGKKDTPTPIFHDSMTHLVLSPYWNVPPTIVKDETLPSALRDSSFLERTNMEVLDRKGQVVDPESIDLEGADAYRFRQRPGSSNALGLVKFMFPNEFNVYLHDTPADSLFARTVRSFSHGCVRLEHPQALAEYLLKDRAEWTRQTIVEAMHAGEEKTVTLREPVPVYIGYWTVDVTPDGKASFLPDVYGLDAPQIAALNGRPARTGQPTRIASRD